MSNLKEEITWLESLVRPNIRALKPYSSARDEFKSGPEARLPSILFLDANENSLGGPLGDVLSRYPDPHQRELKARLAARESLTPEQIFLGNGSDEAIDLLLRAFCTPGQDNIVLLPPTYGMYAVLAGIHGAGVQLAPLDAGFSPNPEAVKAATGTGSKLLFLCSPNNPTGNHLPEAFIREMLAVFPGIVVVDEAYGDFSNHPSLTRLLPEFPNLVVLKTFSKAWGLAGLRVGMAFAHPHIIGVLDKIKYPYNLGTQAISQAILALEQESGVREKVHLLVNERKRLAAGLNQLTCVEQIFPSEANFLLVKTTGADDIYQFLCDRGIIVRNRSKELHCENCLRITVGAPAENDYLLETLHQFGLSR